MSFLKTTAIQHLNGTSPAISFDANGRVGIGVSSPSAKLHVDGTIVSNRENSSLEGGQIGFCRSSDNVMQYTIDAYGSGTTPNLRFVDETAAAVRMAIDSSGRVTTPYNPYFLAGSSSGTHTITDSNLLDFNTTLLNNGNHYNTSTYAFTAPVAGLYQFYFQVYTQNGASQKSIAWKKNGSQYNISDTAIAFQGPTNISDFTLNSSIIFNLNASDYIQVCVRQGSGNLQWYAGHSWWYGYLLG